MKGTNVVRIDRSLKAGRPHTAYEPKPKKSGRQISRLVKSNNKLNKIASTFGIKSKDIYKLVESGNLDAATMQFQQHMFATLMRLIPIAEKEYRQGKRESQAYAMNSLINTARELTSDIAASANRAKITERLLEEIIKPSFQQCMQEVINTHFTLKSKMRIMVSKPERVDDAVDACASEIARFMNEVFKSAAVSISDMMNR